MPAVRATGKAGTSLLPQRAQRAQRKIKTKAVLAVPFPALFFSWMVFKKT
jgi:hypothetical protein